MTTTLELLDRLVAFDTVSAKSNLPIIDFIQTYLTGLGFVVTHVPDPTGQKAGLFASLGQGDNGILLSAHTDVVPVEGQVWTKDPFKLTASGDQLFGRGTTDMKGCLASMLALASRVDATKLNAPLCLSISYDEEVGCLGIGHMIDRIPDSFKTVRAAFIGEPTEMVVATGHKGKVGLRGVAKGEAGHSSLAPKFQNALYVAADFMRELRDLQDWYRDNGARDAAYDIPYTTFHVGTLHGGQALNIVPDRAKLVFEYRYLPADDRSRIETKINALAGDAIDLETIISYPGLATDPENDVVGLAKKLANTNSEIKVAFGTEAGFFDALGIPTIVCGPGSMEGQGHKPDEFITRDQLAACDAMMDRILVEISKSV